MLSTFEKEGKRKWFYKQGQDNVRFVTLITTPCMRDPAAFLLICSLTDERPQRTIKYALRLSDLMETDSNTETHKPEKTITQSNWTNLKAPSYTLFWLNRILISITVSKELGWRDYVWMERMCLMFAWKSHLGWSCKKLIQVVETLRRCLEMAVSSPEGCQPVNSEFCWFYSTEKNLFLQPALLLSALKSNLSNTNKHHRAKEKRIVILKKNICWMV